MKVPFGGGTAIFAQSSMPSKVILTNLGVSPDAQSIESHSGQSSPNGGGSVISVPIIHRCNNFTGYNNTIFFKRVVVVWLVDSVSFGGVDAPKAVFRGILFKCACFSLVVSFSVRSC